MHPLAVIGYPLLAVAMLNFLLGSFLWARSAGEPIRRYAGAIGLLNAGYCWVMAMAYVRAAHGLPYDLYYRAAWVGWIAMAPVAQIIWTLKGDPARAVRWGRALYVLWGSVLLLCLTTNLFEGGAESLLPFVDRLGWFEQPARGVGALTLTWALVELVRVHRASVGRRREQIAYFLFGLAIYAIAGLLLAGVVQIVGDVRFDPGLVSYFSVAWMGFTFYAITRHRLFDVRFVVSRAVLALLLTTLLVCFQATVFGWLASVFGALAAVIIAGVLAGLALFATPLIPVLKRAVELLMLRRRYDYHLAMKESVRALASLGSVDDVLAQLLGSIRDTIASTSAILLLRAGDGFECRQHYGASSAPARLSANSALARWVMQHPLPFVREEQEIGRGRRLDEMPALAADLGTFAGEVAVAMRYRDEVLGILIVGPKADRDAYFQADLDLLETLANEAAIAVTNARLVEDLQEAVRARDDFMTVAGHELRNPLTAVQLSVHTALRLIGDDGPAVERLHAAERQIRRLVGLTEDLLDVSRITAGRTILEPVLLDLGALVRDVAARFADEASRAGSEIELQHNDVVNGHWDKLRLEQVVGNLLSNAVKYGRGHPITIRIESGGGQARLSVRDRGIGIDANDLQRIFDRFERIPGKHRVGGFGLGLWISKQIVEAHGGSIRVHSELGSGSTFIVDLPAEPPGS